jgi:3-methyladenine DNA glycosylase/8-oxoguanine DNA glycosylase
MLVELPEPYSWELSTERFRVFGRDPANLWDDGTLRRVLHGREVAIRPAEGGVEVEPADPAVAAAVRHFLGGPFDLDGFGRFAQTADPTLARIVAELRGLRPPLAPDPFEALVTSITAQQVSLRAAFAIRARLVERFGIPRGRAWEFPSRERLAAAKLDDLRGLGFSGRKAEYVLALARSERDLASLAALPDEDVKRQLTELPGIGEWTADWFLARHLARPDAWPAGDLALRKAVGAFVLGGRDPSIEETRVAGERFRPHRNLTAHYLLVAHRVLGQ